MDIAAILHHVPHGCARRLALLPSLRRRPRPAWTTTCAVRTCGEEYWANAIPGVQGILERDGRVLLARRGREPRLGFWDLPGGFLHETEGAADGLRREFREETGLEIEPVRLLRIDIEPYGGRHVFSVTWLVRADGEPVRLPTMSPSCGGSRRTSCPRWRSRVRTSCWPSGRRDSASAYWHLGLPVQQDGPIGSCARRRGASIIERWTRAPSSI